MTEAGLCNAVNFNGLTNQVGRVNDMMQTQFMQTSQGLASVVPARKLLLYHPARYRLR